MLVPHNKRASLKMFLQCSTMKSIGEKAKRPPVTAVSVDQNTMQPWGTLCSKKEETHSLLGKKKSAVTVSAVIFMIISSSTSSSCKQVTFSVDSPGNCRTGGGEKGVCKEVQHLILEQQEYTKYHRGKTVWSGNCPYMLAACSTAGHLAADESQ